MSRLRCQTLITFSMHTPTTSMANPRLAAMYAEWWWKSDLNRERRVLIAADRFEETGQQAAPGQLRGGAPATGQPRTAHQGGQRTGTNGGSHRCISRSLRWRRQSAKEIKSNNSKSRFGDTSKSARDFHCCRLDHPTMPPSDHAGTLPLSS
jgi:hypothetical protein